MNVRLEVVRYAFAKGEGLPEHAHEAAALHDIVVLTGRFKVAKDSGDVEAGPGDRVTFAVGEKHSLEALEDGETRHTLVNL